MKKSKLSLGLISCLLSVGTLAGCNTLKSSSDGVLLSYTVDGEKKVITADEILGDYYNDSTKYQAIYDTIYSVIARNYFSKVRKGPTAGKYVGVELGKPQMEKIEREAREKVSDDKDTAQTNADTNNTKYKKEFESILESKGVESEEELFDKYVEELQKETFEDNFYTYFVEDIKNGDPNTKLDGDQFWTGYFEDQVPYHVSHILVKLSDSSDTNYADGTISEDNAERLHDVIEALGKNEKSFAKIAMTYNEDPGSKDKEGDLGIMDYDTSFINEFKLGIYAYEQFYNESTAASAKDSKIAAPGDAGDRYNAAVLEAFKDNTGITADDIPTVKLSVFNELNEVRKTEKDEKGKAVMENAALVFPRNIIYNKYLNRHAVFFIENDTGVDLANYKPFGKTGHQKNILCANGDATKPIIAVRASSGGEQEIHLMVVNRSPFAESSVSMSDYYTTYYPAQTDYYPTNEGNQLDTYVNFLTNDTSDTKTRAEEVASKLKSYDSDKLGKYIFLKYKAEENITFAKENKDLEEALMKWIKTSIEKKAEEKEESWTKTWNEYIDKLVRQNSERSKLVPQACKLVYLKGNSTKTVAQLLADAEENFNLTAEQIAEMKAEIKASGCADTNNDGETTDAEVESYYGTAVVDWFKKEGGLCNDGKAHF